MNKNDYLCGQNWIEQLHEIMDEHYVSHSDMTTPWAVIVLARMGRGRDYWTYRARSADFQWLNNLYKLCR